MDGVSALVAHQIPMTKWNIDCLVSGSQKGFGTPPGLAFIALSSRAWARVSKRRKFYFDLIKERKGQESGATSWTPATSLIRTLNASLDILNNIGVEGCANYHKTAAQSCRSAAFALGLETFSKSHHSSALTAIRLPDDIDGNLLLKHAKEKYHALFAGGQDQVKGKIIRIAHLGIFDSFDLLNAIAALEFSLSDFGANDTIGKGVAAAMTQLQTGNC